MKNKTCCIFNFAPHYRKAIYTKMDKELNCDFFFGDKVPGTMESMDKALLKNYKGDFINVLLGRKIIWQKGIIKLLFRNYKSYVMSVDRSALSSWIFILLALVMRKKIYFWTHGVFGNEKGLKKIVNRVFFSTADSIFLYSNYGRAQLMKNGIQNEKLFVIANSLDYEESLTIRKQLKQKNIYKTYFNNDYATLIFTGRLEAKKKLEMIIDAIYLLKKDHLHINCVFIGDGSQKPILEEKANNLNIASHFWFVGACYDESKIAQYIYEADICISPGNVGLTAIHSLSYGTPVITHDNFEEQMPEFEAIEDGVTGTFFKQNNLSSLNENIKKWLQKYPRKNFSLIEKCFDIIDAKYNPNYQILILKKVL